MSYPSSSRGGRGRGYFRSAPRPAPSAPVHDLSEGIEDIIKAFDRNASAPVAPVRITDVRPIASYSWLNTGGKEPTVRVPGSPPVWNNTNPVRVPQDRGMHYVDQNAARMGSKGSPLNPLFAAMKAMNKTEELADHDLITDRNSLRKLFRWATGSTDEKDFRIDVERVGETCIFTRREEHDVEYIKEFRGFGQSYKDEATTPAKGCETATGHHRIVSMTFGGIQTVIRFELDACTSGAVPESPNNAAEDELDSLTSAMGKLNTVDAQSEVIFGVTVIKSESQALVPQSDLIELKTRVAHRPLDWEETYPQLYLSQTPHLYLSRHTKGVFEPPERYTLGDPALEPYSAMAKEGMGKLKVVLREILQAVGKEKEGAGLSLVCESGELALHRRKEGTGKMLESEIKALFD